MFTKRKYDFDLIVIGSGSGGSVGAHYARNLGKKVAIFEGGAIGGECPNFACVPTKALLHAAHIYETVQNAHFYGTLTTKIDLDYSKVKAWKDIVVSRTGAAHGEQSFKHEGLTVIKEYAKFVSAHEVEAGDKKYSAAKFLVATGSTVFIPPIPGLKESGYITFKEAVDFEDKPKSIFILGGGPIGCEFAQVFATFGSEVILADTLPKLVAKEDAETSDLLQALFENRGVKVLTAIEVTKVEKEGNKKRIFYIKNGQEHSVSSEELLVATGKRSVLNFGPEAAGIKIDEKGHIQINKYLQTSNPNVFIAGDIAGPYLFTHTGYYQSYVAVNNAFSSKKIVPNYDIVPRCVFTIPEVASVGLSEAQTKEMGIKIKVGLCAISMLGRANTSNEFDGFIKVITKRDETIIGASIVAMNAGEMIHELALAVRLKVKASVIADMLHAYPTFSEGIKIACSSLENR